MAGKKTKKTTAKKADKKKDGAALLPDVADAAAKKDGAKTKTLVRRDPLQQYLQVVRQSPRLTDDEVHQLAVRVYQHKDRDAAIQLITSHLYVVVSIAFQFQNQFQNMLDLVQEGNIGLMRAVEKFDPFKGVKLPTYASYWIRAYIIKYILDNWRLVKVGTTNMRRKLLFNLNRVTEELKAAGMEAGPKQLAEHFNASEEDIVAVQKSLGTSDLSLEAQVADDSSRTYSEVISDHGDTLEEEVGTDQLVEQVNRHIREFAEDLKENEREILFRRLMAEEPVTLAEIGDKYGVSREAIRQAETRLKKKLKEYLKEKLPGIENLDFVERGDS